MLKNTRGKDGLLEKAIIFIHKLEQHATFELAGKLSIFYLIWLNKLTVFQYYDVL